MSYEVFGDDSGELIDPEETRDCSECEGTMHLQFPVSGAFFVCDKCGISIDAQEIWLDDAMRDEP